MKVMTVINNVLGLRPFDDSKGQPRVLLSLPYLVLLWSLVIGSLVLMVIFDKSLQDLEKYARLLRYYPYISNGFCSTFLGFYHSKAFLGYKKKMWKADDTLFKLGVPSKYRASSVSSMILIIACFWQTAYSIYECTEWFIPQAGIPSGLYIGCFYGYVAHAGDVVLYDFIICVRSVKLRYEKLNDLLEAYTTGGFQTQENNYSSRASIPVIPLRSNNWMRRRNNITTQEHSSRTEEQWEYIEEKSWRLQLIQQVHLDLSQASNLLCKSFRWQVELQIGWTLLTTILTLYHMYFIIPGSSFNGQWVMSNACSIAYCIVDFMKLFVLSQACEHICREAERALRILHACYSSLNDTGTKDPIRQFALQMYHCRKGCTERYFSGLNYTFLSECVGVVSTYVFVLVQFAQALE